MASESETNLNKIFEIMGIHGKYKLTGDYTVLNILV